MPNYSAWQQTADNAAFFEGLPSVATPRGGRNPNIGATLTPATNSTVNGQVVAQPIKVVGVPSLTIYQGSNGGTVIELRRNLLHPEELSESDLELMKRQGDAVLNLIISLSQGPLTQAWLNKHGNPYGRDTSGGLRGVRRTKSGRGDFGSGRSAKGVRGAVPSLAMINVQSGELLRSWHYRQERTSTGIVMQWINDTKESWYVTHGTVKMVAHGPATYAPVMELGNIDQAWQSLGRLASQRANEEQLAQSLKVSAPESVAGLTEAVI